MNRDLSKFNPSKDRPVTELMKDMKTMNKNCIKQFIDYWKEKVMTNTSEDGNFMEKQKILYSNRVGGELIVNGKFNSKSILVTFAGKNNNIFDSDLT